MGGGIYGDMFLAQFNGKGKNTFGTYFGGAAGYEYGYAIAHDYANYVYIAGSTMSTSGIATPGSYQDVYPGGVQGNGFIAKFCFSPSPDLLTIDGPDTLCAHSSASYTVAPVAHADGYIWELPKDWEGASNTNNITLTHNNIGGKLGVRVIRCNDTSEISYFDVFVRPSDPPIITVDGFELGTVGTYSSYQWFLDGQPIPGAASPRYTVKINGAYTVVTQDVFGCTDTSDIYRVSNTGTISISDRNRLVLIHPNPASDMLHIQAPIQVNITVYSLDGRQLDYLEDAKTLNLQHYSPGIYLIRISDKEGRPIKTEKFIKGR
jgi:hypothetical protein